MLNFMMSGRIPESKMKYFVITGKFSNHSLAPEAVVVMIDKLHRGDRVHHIGLAAQYCSDSPAT